MKSAASWRRSLAVLGGIGALLLPGLPDRVSGAPVSLPVHSLVTGSSSPDIVKLSNIVVDENRRRTYFAASLSRYIGVVDADSFQMVGTIDSQVDGFVARFLFLNPATGILHMFVTNTSQLYRIDPFTGSVSAPMTVGRAPAFDTSSNRLYISEPPDKVRVYDELLQPVDVITGVAAPGELFIDSAQGKLYVVNSAPLPQAGVSVYATTTKQLIRTYDMPPGFDGLPKGIHVDGGTIYVSGNTIKHSLSIIDEASGGGTFISLSENGLRMETYGGRLYQMTGYPYCAGYLPSADGSYGIIEVRDALTGAKERDVWADLESLYFDIDQTTGRLFYTATGRGTLGVIQLSDYATLATIDVATTIEDVLVHPSDGSVYLRNRLGGSTIYRVDPGTGTLTGTLNPGNWPTKILLDAGRNRLYALSHHEAKISVYNLSNDALVDTISLGTQRARTDALSTMAMDRSLGKLYAVMPELGTLTVVNADGSGAPLTISIDGFSPSQATGPGKLHIAVNESLGRVYVFNTDAKRLNIYDGATLSLLSYATISAYSLTTPPLDLVFSDDAGGRLLVGPHIVDPQTGAVTGQIAAGQKVIGASPSGDRFYVWDLVPSGFYERVLEYDASLQTVLRQWGLSPITGVYSAFGFDFARAKMYVGYFDRGALDVVDLGQAASIWLMSGKTLRVSDGVRRKLVVVSTDPSIASPAPGGAAAPTNAGAVLEVLNPATGETDTFPLPAANWKGLGTPAGSTGYRYTDTTLAAGPCKAVRVWNSKRLHARCQGAGITFSLDEASQGSLGVRLTMGSADRHCMLFGGTIVKDEPGTFRAKDAPAPAACP